MSLLAFLGVASAIAYGVSSESKIASYKSRKKALLEATNYNIDVRENFGDICYVCGVEKDDSHTKVFGINCNNDPSIWPKDGWQKCTPFLEELPNLTDDDIQDFIDAYEYVRNQSLQELQKCYDQRYLTIEKAFKKKEEPNGLIFYEKDHWDLISVDRHQQMMENIYNNTFWNEIATGPAKILDNGFGTRREIWQVKNYDKSLLDTYYHNCQNRCGYNDLML